MKMISKIKNIYWINFKTLGNYVRKDFIAINKSYSKLYTKGKKTKELIRATLRLEKISNDLL